MRSRAWIGITLFTLSCLASCSEDLEPLVLARCEDDVECGTGFICELGECSFFLQDFYDQKLAENLMLQLVVTDIEQAFEQANSFPNETKISGIEHHPWGKVFYLWGPSGELWHICELNNS